jgi:hypothetical protein
MGLITSRVFASGCAAFIVFSSAVAGARAAAVVVAKHENLEHYTVNSPAPASESYSPFFTLHTDGVKPFLPSNGWAPLLTEAQPKVQAGDPGATSTTPKKSFSFVGDSTAAGNWTDGNGVPAGITLTFDAELTITAMSLTAGDAPFLTVPGASNTNQSGRGIGVTSVPGGADDINFVPQRGLAFSPVTVSNVSFSGTLAEPGYTFTPGGVSGFGVELFASGVFNELTQGMILTPDASPADTIGFGVTDGATPETSKLAMNLNFGPYSPGPAGGSATPADPSSVFPRQSGPFTLVVTASGSTIRGFTLGYDVNYDISPSTGVDADFDGDGDVDGADFLTWQQNNGLGAGATNQQGDADGNQAVDGLDLAAWQANFGPGAAVPSSTAIPEPATAALAALGLLLAVATRKRAG